MFRRHTAGLTLVELLVVVAIIGLLVALLLPAVQSAREAARRVTCSNNLRQISLGSLQHESHHGALPSGGWGFLWVGDPDRGAGPNQPGGWCYSLLPFLEQSSLWQLGSDGDPRTITPAQAQGGTRVVQTSIPVFTCPSRRSARPWPVINMYDWPKQLGTTQDLTLNARGDYAACAGDPMQPYDMAGPPSLATGDSWTASHSWTANLAYASSADPGGVCYIRSQMKIASIRDGSSNTLLIGEKYLNPDDYFTGRDSGDNQSMFSGYNHDTHRSVRIEFAPRQDQRGIAAPENFGSIHAGSFTMGFCDGSVRGVSYSVNPETFRRLGLRKDALPVDTGDL